MPYVYDFNIGAIYVSCYTLIFETGEKFHSDKGYSLMGNTSSPQINLPRRQKGAKQREDSLRTLASSRHCG